MELEELVSTSVFGEDEVIARRWLVAGGRDRLSLERQLRTRAAGSPDGVYLRGVRKPRRHEQFAPRRMPVGKARGAGFGIPPHILDERLGNRRNAFDNEVVAGRQRRWRLRGGQCGNVVSAFRRTNEQQSNGRAEDYAEHSPSITSGLNAWFSPRSIRSCSPISVGSSWARSLSASVAIDGGTRRKKAPSSSFPSRLSR